MRELITFSFRFSHFSLRMVLDCWKSLAFARPLPYFRCSNPTNLGSHLFMRCWARQTILVCWFKKRYYFSLLSFFFSRFAVGFAAELWLPIHLFLLTRQLRPHASSLGYVLPRKIFFFFSIFCFLFYLFWSAVLTWHFRETWPHWSFCAVWREVGTG